MGFNIAAGFNVKQKNDAHGVRVTCADPAGNITAIIRDDVPVQKRAAIADEILKAGIAEQAGFEAVPSMGGDMRLEMMGGEFCGNALRSYAYLKVYEESVKRERRCENDVTDGQEAKENCNANGTRGGRDVCGAGYTRTVNVEISGANEPLKVSVNLGEQTSFAEIPLPRRLDRINIEGREYPVVRMHGIDHLIAEGKEPDVLFAQSAVAVMKKADCGACGILFLNGGSLTPAVYVRATDSMIWESSCGSGSVACGWYLAKRALAEQKAGAEERAEHAEQKAETVMENAHITDNKKRSETIFQFGFSQPGGKISVEIAAKDGRVTECKMGGNVKISETFLI